MTPAMSELISFKSTPHGVHWHVTKDDTLVTAYSVQFIAERAATRLAVAAARQGRNVRTLFYREDGTVGSEHFYQLPANSRR